MNTSNLIIETKNLVITPIRLNFKDEIFKEFTPQIATYMSPQPAQDIQGTIDFIQESIRENEKGTNYQAVVLDKHTHEFLGAAGLHHINTEAPELGIWIKKSAHGHGYGKEAMVALKTWADDNLHYEYLRYPVDKDNIPSRKIPEFLGGQIFKEYTEENMIGKILNLLEYRIYPNS